jgi:hypothetical protein
MFGLGRKDNFKDGDYIFAAVGEGEYSRVIVGLVEFGGMGRVKVAGLYIKPAGLIEKARSGRLNPRVSEVLKEPTPNNLIHILIDRVESGDYHDYVDVDKNAAYKIGAKRYTEIDTWIREGFPDLFSIMLSPTATGKEEAKKVFLEKMDKMYDQELKQTVSAVAKQLKIF